MTTTPTTTTLTTPSPAAAIPIPIPPGQAKALDRADLSGYRAAHRAVRRAPHLLATAVRELDPTDRTRCRAVARFWKGYAGEVLAHHTIEDEVCFPALVARVPEAARLIERTDTDHHVLDELMASCAAAVDGLADGSSTPAVAAGRLSLLAAHMDAHLDFEDAEVLPLFELHFSYGDYEAMDEAARKHIGLGAQAAFTIPFLVAFMGEEERQRVFGTAPLPLKVLYRVSRGRYARLATRALGAGAEGTGVVR